MLVNYYQKIILVHLLDVSHHKNLLWIQEQAPNASKTSASRTLKDHLYQCPSRLSEEMVRSMASVYCWLCCTSSANMEQNKSQFLTKSPTILPQQGVGKKKEWLAKSAVEISWISTDKNNFSRASYAINNYRLVFIISKRNVKDLSFHKFEILNGVSLNSSIQFTTAAKLWNCVKLLLGDNNFAVGCWWCIAYACKAHHKIRFVQRKCSSDAAVLNTGTYLKSLILQ